MSQPNPSSPIEITLAQSTDIPTLLTIAHQAFAKDSHTLFKMHEKGSTSFESEMPKEMYTGNFENGGEGPRQRLDKGVLYIARDGNTGEILGSAGWGFWNLNGEKVVNPSDPPPTPLDAPITYPSDPTQPPLDRLKAITSGYLSTMYDRLCLPSKKIIFCNGITVSPKAQGRGIGSMLIKEAVRLGEEKGIDGMWVHLSDNEAGVRAFVKNGFKEVGRVTVDLDEYRLRDMPEGKEKWGEYTFRCLARDWSNPKTSE